MVGATHSIDVSCMYVGHSYGVYCMDPMELDWIGPDSINQTVTHLNLIVGLDWIELHQIGLDWFRPDRTKFDGIGRDSIKPNFIRLDSSESDR